MNKCIFSIILFLSIYFNLTAQESIPNKIYKTGINTVLMYREGWELSYPVIKLNSDQKLIFEFDDLVNTKNITDYQYTIIHCDENWVPSNVQQMEYLDGFPENYIDDYRLSFNTLQPYVHYRVVLPNQNLKLKISGNYIIKVYEKFDPENIVITQRFSLYEDLVSIEGNVKQPSLPQYRLTGQEVDFTIKSLNYKINNPFEELKIVICQNNRFDNAIKDLKPKYVLGNDLIYDYNLENVFMGESEFRYFDCKSVRFASDRTDSIYYIAPNYHFTLIEDYSRNREAYSFHQDLNGKYFVKSNEGFNNQLESDYVWVHFVLKADAPRVAEKIYVAGGFSNWQTSDFFIMRYNFDFKQYECAVLLKQGYYNYEYLLIDKNNEISAVPLEGSHSETENDYVLYVYHSNISVGYSRLIAVAFLNSQKKF